MQEHQEDKRDNESLARKAMGDLVLGQFFLVQATLESAAAIEDGLQDIGRHFRADETTSADERPLEPFGKVLRRTREQAIEPYSTRFKYLRELVSKDLAA